MVKGVKIGEPSTYRTEEVDFFPHLKMKHLESF